MHLPTTQHPRDRAGGHREPIDLARATLWTAGSIVVRSGAGLSTDCGIPDFWGPDGTWTLDPEAETRSDITHFLADPAIRAAKWRAIAAEHALALRPNPGHHAITALAATGRVRLVVTQNTDSLHLAAGLDPALLVEVHGNHRDAQCTVCGHRSPIGPVLAQVAAGAEDPRCARIDEASWLCGGILKPAVVFFGEALDPAGFRRAKAAVARADLLLCVGSSLNVYPVADLVPYARHTHGATVVIINGTATEADRHAAVVVRGSPSAVLPALVGPA